MHSSIHLPLPTNFEESMTYLNSLNVIERVEEGPVVFFNRPVNDLEFQEISSKLFSIHRYEYNLIRQREQRVFGRALASQAIDLAGAKNLELIDSGVQVDIVQVATALGKIQALLESGAIGIASDICKLYKSNFQTHLEIFELVISEVDNFRTQRGYK